MSLRRPLVMAGSNNFDAIRIAMALLVVWSHSFALHYGTESFEPISLLMSGTMNAGNLAVDVFFMVSGFLITQSFERSRSAGSYLRKRVARIYPGYLVATGLCAFALLPWFAGTRYSLATAAKTLGLNLLLQGWFVDTEPFTGNPVHALNGALWSIPFEFWCYLGVLATGGAGVLRRRTWLLSSFFVVIVLHMYCDATGKRPGLGYLGLIIGFPYFWLRMLPCFMAGMLVYLYRDDIPRSMTAAIVGLVMLVAGAHISLPVADLLIPIVIPYLVFLIAFGGERFRAAAYGDFSYGTYLYAFPIQQLLVARTQLPFPAYVLAAMGCSLAAGILSWYCVERWFHRSAKSTPNTALLLSEAA